MTTNNESEAQRLLEIPEREVIYLTGPRDPMGRGGAGKMAAAYGETAHRLMNEKHALVMCAPTYWAQFGAVEQNETDREKHEDGLRAMREMCSKMVVLELPGWDTCEYLKRETAWAEEAGVTSQAIPMDEARLSPGATALTLRTLPEEKQQVSRGPALVGEKKRQYRAIMTTSAGVIEFDLDATATPAATGSFVHLAKQGFYDDQAITLVVKDLMIQGGCPNGDGTGDAGYHYSQERSVLTKSYGKLAMAPDAEGNSCQWFIMLGDGPRGAYTVFGSLASGQETLTTLNETEVQEPDSEMAYRPVEPVKVEKVEIKETWTTSFTSANRETDSGAKSSKKTASKGAGR